MVHLVVLNNSRTGSDTSQRAHSTDTSKAASLEKKIPLTCSILGPQQMGLAQAQAQAKCRSGGACFKDAGDH